jgi:hypothetical protein
MLTWEEGRLENVKIIEPEPQPWPIRILAELEA